MKLKGEHYIIQNICLFLIGFVIAVMDRAHLKLKMEYKQKKKVQKKLEFAVEKNLYYKVINKLNNFHCIQNVSSYNYDSNNKPIHRTRSRT